MYFAISISSCRCKHTEKNINILESANLYSQRPKFGPVLVSVQGYLRMRVWLPTGNLVWGVCVCVCVCVCVHRLNTHHVKNDGVVSARYLHCDGWLVVRYGADVLPPVTHTEKMHTGIEFSYTRFIMFSCIFSPLCDTHFLMITDRVQIHLSWKKKNTYLWSMMDLPFLCLTNTPMNDTPMKISLV